MAVVDANSNNAQWRLIDLKRLDMTIKSSIPIEDGTHGIKDITGDFKPTGVPGEKRPGGQTSNR